MSKRFGVEQIFDALRSGEEDNDIWQLVTVDNPKLGRKKLLDEILPSFREMLANDKNLMIAHIILTDKETHLLADVVDALEARELGGPDEVREVVSWLNRLQGNSPHEQLMHLKDALEFLQLEELTERAKAIWPKHFEENKE